MRISDWSSDVCSSDLFGDRHVHVHARTVVAVQRLRHEGRGAAVGVSNVVYAVLQGLDFVSLLDQRVEFHADFVLAGSRHFVVVNRSEEHTSELQSLMRISYAVFCLKTKKIYSAPPRLTSAPITNHNSTPHTAPHLFSNTSTNVYT